MEHVITLIAGGSGYVHGLTTMAILNKVTAVDGLFGEDLFF